MKNKRLAETFTKYLDELYPDARCFLNYSKDYELVIAVMLSAQTTDVSVNKVTEVLFNKYPTLESFVQLATFKEIESIIQPLGLSTTKAKNIINIVNTIYKEWNSTVKNDKEQLMTLSGVGNKTANVVLIELFDAYEFPVDTHINRIAKRLSFAGENDSITVVERKLKDAFDKKLYKKLHHQIILFGRNICNARKPKCGLCELKDVCSFYHKLSK